MKIIILVFLIGLSFAYNTGAAVKYARTYCSSYHYNDFGMEPDDARFVSQCMIAGGMNFRSCSVSWIDDHGCLPRVADLKSCLQQKGWKHSTTRPASFKAGYPIFLTTTSHAMLATGIQGGCVLFSAHSNDRCDATICSNIEYYYEN